MDFKIPIDLEKLQKAAAEKITAEIQTSLKNTIYSIGQELFAVRREHNGRVYTEEGYIRALIRQRAEEYATSPEFEAKIQEAIARHIDTAADDAILAMLRSATRRRIFTAVPHRIEKDTTVS